MKKRLLLVPAILMVMTACAGIKPAEQQDNKPRDEHSQQALWQEATGSWYGNRTMQDGSREQWIIERFPQGSYKITSRIYADDTALFEEKVGVGHWGISGPIYFTMFRGWIEGEMITPVNSKDAGNYNAYRIESRDANMFSYQHFVTGGLSTEKRVGENAVFPE